MPYGYNTAPKVLVGLTRCHRPCRSAGCRRPCLDSLDSSRGWRALYWPRGQRSRRRQPRRHAVTAVCEKSAGSACNGWIGARTAGAAAPADEASGTAEEAAGTTRPASTTEEPAVTTAAAGRAGPAVAEANAAGGAVVPVPVAPWAPLPTSPVIAWLDVLAALSTPCWAVCRGETFAASVRAYCWAPELMSCTNWSWNSAA